MGHPLRSFVAIARRQRWIARSVLVGAVASFVDYVLVVLLARQLEAPTPLAGAVGLLTGATFNFVLSRRWVFRAQASPLAPQLARFALAIGALLLVHAASLWFWRDHLGVPLVPAKVLSDLLVLATTQPFVLRRFVFSPAPRAWGVRVQRA